MSTPNYSPSSVDFTCQCGTEFNVGGRPGRYLCRRCSTATYFGISEQEWTAKYIAREKRRQRVLAATARLGRLQAAIWRRMQPGEGYGSALDRFESLARRYGRTKLAEEISLLLHTCGCDRQTAIEQLNQSGWPSN